jgi:hypothetical protein
MLGVGLLKRILFTSNQRPTNLTASGVSRAEIDDGSLCGCYRVLYGMGGVEGLQSLNEEREKMAVLFVEGNGLPSDRGDDFSGLRKKRLATRVMRIFNEMECDLPPVFKVHLGFSRTGRRNMRCAENSRAVPEIRKGDIQTAVVAKNYLEGFDAQITSSECTNHACATDGIDVSGLKTLHSWNCNTARIFTGLETWRKGSAKSASDVV